MSERWGVDHWHQYPGQTEAASQLEVQIQAEEVGTEAASQLEAVEVGNEGRFEGADGSPFRHQEEV